MTIIKDVVRAVEGYDHLNQEVLRNNVILTRNVACLALLRKSDEDHGDISTMISDFTMKTKELLGIKNIV